MLPMKPSFQPSQVVAYDSSTQSSALNARTTVVRLVATTNCHVKFGSNPTATTSDIYLPAGVVEYFKVSASDKVAAIKNADAGNLYVTEMTN